MRDLMRRQMWERAKHRAFIDGVNRARDGTSAAAIFYSMELIEQSNLIFRGILLYSKKEKVGKKKNG